LSFARAVRFARIVPTMANTKNEMSAGPNPSTTDPLISRSTMGTLREVVSALACNAPVKDHRDQENPQVAGLDLAHDLQAFKPAGI
jgi:hypothetical protein